MAMTKYDRDVGQDNNSVCEQAIPAVRPGTDAVVHWARAELKRTESVLAARRRGSLITEIIKSFSPSRQGMDELANRSVSEGIASDWNNTFRHLTSAFCHQILERESGKAHDAADQRHNQSGTADEFMSTPTCIQDGDDGLDTSYQSLGKQKYQEDGDVPSRMAEVSRTVTFSGTVPSPNLLRDYEEVHSGLADRLVSMTEKENKHRRSLEKAFISARLRGQWMVFSLALVSLLGGIYLVAVL